MPLLASQSNQSKTQKMQSFNSWKIWLVEFSGLEKDALHIYVALLVFLTACLACRWKAFQWKPWFAVLIVVLAGESIDIYETIGIEGRTYLWGNWHDVRNTMLLPTVIMIMARYSNIFGTGPGKPSTEAAEKLGDQP